jgi:SAM-dependent methyltransferase
MLPQTREMSLLRRLVELNLTLSDRLQPSHVEETHALRQFVYHGTIALLEGGAKRVVDVGAGKTFHFGDVLSQREDIYVIGLDVDAAEMADNVALSEKIECDVCTELPVDDASIDVMLARATIEHLHDVRGFLNIAYRKLRPGGKLIVTFPGRWAFFAILNQILPVRVSHLLLSWFVPHSEGILGFPAYYDQATYARFSRASDAAGFTELVGYPSYYGTGYFRFCTPLFLIVYVLDSLRVLIGHRSLASYNTFVVVKR